MTLTLRQLIEALENTGAPDDTPVWCWGCDCVNKVSHVKLKPDNTSPTEVGVEIEVDTTAT